MSKLLIRRNYILVFMTIFFVFFAVRLYQLQVIDDSFKEKAKTTGLKREVITPSRGLLYDRNDNLLVYNEFQSDIYFTYNDLDPDMDVELFCRLLHITDSSFRVRISKDWSQSRYSKNVPTVFMEKVEDSLLTAFREHLFQFPGFEVFSKTARGYNYASAPHTIGYISEVSPRDLEEKSDYAIGDYIGISGLEAYYEQDLRGEKGLKVSLMDNVGRRLGSYQNGVLDRAAKEGYNLKLTLDIELQQLGEKLLTNKRGAMVAIEPNSGEILAIMSAPSYDPSLLSIGQGRGEVYSDLARDSAKPLFNRSLMAHYPPGSLFKPILALIGLQEGIITPEERIRCTGAYYHNNHRWGCHAGPGIHDLNSALSVSCNTYFYMLYEKLVQKYGYDNPQQGLDELSDKLRSMGLGTKLGVDLNQEAKGLNPDAKYYDDRYDRDRWRATYILSNGIGQGEVEITTLQMANLAAIIANRGYFVTPHLIKNYQNVDKPIPMKWKERMEVGIDYDHFEHVIEGMSNAIRYGTAVSAYVPGLDICGKTGTSQNPHGADHSVFFGFAPRDNPKIAVAVYIENGGWGGSYAAPMGGLMMEQYLNDSIADNRQWLLNRMVKN